MWGGRAWAGHLLLKVGGGPGRDVGYGDVVFAVLEEGAEVPGNLFSQLASGHEDEGAGQLAVWVVFREGLRNKELRSVCAYEVWTSGRSSACLALYPNYKE